ncbi:hypothetical protein Q426_04285 [Streptococcus equi subsp. zooepidemicus CY]|nr:hypothetical protein Q426_04285 [Streptococcus equi subsp. zooepidemicus CY]
MAVFFLNNNKGRLLLAFLLEKACLAATSKMMRSGEIFLAKF